MTDLEALDAALTELGAATGCVHRVRDDHLFLCAERGLPQEVVAHIRHIPKGKGMAGQAWLTKTTVSTCNLSTDESGHVRERAKQVNAQSALAIPVLNTNGQVEAVVGFAYSDGDEIGPERLSACIAAASKLVSESKPT